MGKHPAHLIYGFVLGVNKQWVQRLNAYTSSLTKLYEETAECLPDGINSNKRPRQGRDRFDPPEMDRDNVKHLPPGSIREYHAQCQALYPQHTISKKLFSSVSCLGFKQHFLILEFLRKIFSCFPLGAENWWQQFLGLQVWQRYFKGLLRIRFDSHHAKCGQCLKHRMILKRLGNNPAAQRCQRAELDRHLKRQHADRQIYYLSRARSRLDASSSAPVTITCILDSMDQAKHSWPRSKAMQAKQFANFNRPRLIQTTMLCHGHGMVMALSPHHVSANSSRSCEVIAAGLTLLERQRRVDMRQVTLSIQGDNCSKELKNMTCLRMLALKTSLGHVKASELSFLSSGHSHEDIDAFFAVARKWLEKSRELWVPEAFRESLQQFVDNPAVRPYEKFRKVVLMSQYRNWKLSLNMMASLGVTP